jgi:hypothetical protein
MTMQRKQRVRFATTKSQSQRSYLTVAQIEERFSLLLQLLQHNFDKLVQRTKVRRR